MKNSQNLVGNLVMPSPFVLVLLALVRWLRKD